jgi:hypothetical protein
MLALSSDRESCRLTTGSGIQGTFPVSVFVEPPFSFFFATNLTESVVVVLYLNEDTEI